MMVVVILWTSLVIYEGAITPWIPVELWPSLSCSSVYVSKRKPSQHSLLPLWIVLCCIRQHLFIFPGLFSQFSPIWNIKPCCAHIIYFFGKYSSKTTLLTVFVKLSCPFLHVAVPSKVQYAWWLIWVRTLFPEEFYLPVW